MRRLILRIGLMAVSFLFATCLAYGQLDPNTKVMTQPGFGVIGIAFGQSAKLNAYVDMVDLDLFPPGPCTADETGFPPGPCKLGPWKITMTVLNGDGSVLAQSVQSVGLHQVVTLDFKPTDLPFAPIRKRIRPVITIDPDENGVIPCLKQTFELIDNNTQRTVIAYQGADNLMEGKMMAETRTLIGLVGITPGQTARLNVVNTQDFFPVNGFPPGPCKVTLSFYDVNGRLISSTSGVLQPGKAASLDFNTMGSGGGGGTGRVAVRAEVIVDVDERGLVPAVMPTLE